jgi:putative ABC transport system permease protein
MMEHKAQYIGALVMVMVSCLLFVAMMMVSNNLDSMFNDFSSNNVLGDAEFQVERPLDITMLESKFDAKIEKSSMVDYDLNPGQTLRIFAENSRVNIHEVVEGNELSSKGILIDKLFAGANGLSIGDSLSIQGRKYEINGYMVLPNYIYIIKSKEEMINDPKTFGIAVLSKENQSTIEGGYEFYSVRFNNRENVHQQEVELKAYLLSQGTNILKWESTENNNKVTVVAMEVKTLSSMSKAVPGSLLLLTVILLSILIKRMIKRESVVVGTLYAQGYRKKELIMHYMTFSIIISLLGGIIGALAGFGLVKPMINFLMMAFTMPHEKIIYTLYPVMISLLAPAIFICSASFFVINGLLKKTPAELMKGIKSSDKSNLFEKKLKLDRFKFKTKFQIREQVRNLSRSGFLLFGVIVATILLLYGLTLQSSLDYMLNEGIASLYNLKYEYVYNELKQEAPPTGFEQFNAIYVTPDFDRNSNFAIIGALPDTLRLNIKNLKGEKIVPDKVIITNILSNKLDIKKGDEITVISDEDLSKYTIKIEEIADSAAGEFMFMPLDDLNAMTGYPAGSYIGIWGDEKLEFGKGEIRSTKSMDAIAAGIKNLIVQTGIMVYGLTISSFFLGLIIIFIVTGLIIEENRNTISLIKVFGYKKKEVNKLILDSNTYVVILGYILGVPILVTSVSALMQSLTDSMQMMIPVHLNIWYIVFGFVVVMFTYESAKFLSKRKINKIPMSEALKAGTE